MPPSARGVGVRCNRIQQSPRPICMRTALQPLVAAALLPAVTLASCSADATLGDDEPAVMSCSLAAVITFDGRQYMAAESLPGLHRRAVQKGKRLATGEAAACPGRDGQDVRVFKVVGVHVEDAVFSKPVFGLMSRWNEDRSIE